MGAGCSRNSTRDAHLLMARPEYHNPKHEEWEGFSSAGVTQPVQVIGRDGKVYRTCGIRCHKTNAPRTDNYTRVDPCIKYCDGQGCHYDPFADAPYPDEKGVGLNYKQHKHLGTNDLKQMTA